MKSPRFFLVTGIFLATTVVASKSFAREESCFSLFSDRLELSIRTQNQQARLEETSPSARKAFYKEMIDQGLLFSDLHERAVKRGLSKIGQTESGEKRSQTREVERNQVSHQQNKIKEYIDLQIEKMIFNLEMTNLMLAPKQTVREKTSEYLESKNGVEAREVIQKSVDEYYSEVRSVVIGELARRETQSVANADLAKLRSDLEKMKRIDKYFGSGISTDWAQRIVVNETTEKTFVLGILEKMSNRELTDFADSILDLQQNESLFASATDRALIDVIAQTYTLDGRVIISPLWTATALSGVSALGGVLQLISGDTASGAAALTLASVATASGGTILLGEKVNGWIENMSIWVSKKRNTFRARRDAKASGLSSVESSTK